MTNLMTQREYYNRSSSHSNFLSSPCSVTFIRALIYSLLHFSICILSLKSFFPYLIMFHGPLRFSDFLFHYDAHLRHFVFSYLSRMFDETADFTDTRRNNVTQKWNNGLILRSSIVRIISNTRLNIFFFTYLQVWLIIVTNHGRNYAGLPYRHFGISVSGRSHLKSVSKRR